MNTRVSDLPDIGTLDGSEYIPVISGVRSYKATISQIGSTGVSGVSSVNTRTGAVKLSKSDVDLENVDNTADINKPVSTAMQTALNGKVATNDARLSDARIPTEHTHDQSEVTGLVDALEAKADLVDGVVPASQLPSYVDDILEYDTFAGFPATGEAGKIYVAKDTNLTYRWSGSTYVEISASLALGETSSTAYRGDRGAIAYAHSLVTGNPHGTAMSDISGLVSTLEAKLDASGYTAADVLEKLLTVDTDTAGINATTLKSVSPGAGGLLLLDLSTLSSATPKALGTASAGSSNTPARDDHAHLKPTIEDIMTSNFTSVGFGNTVQRCIVSDPSGNIWAAVYGGDIYKCPVGSTTFAAVGAGSKYWWDVCADISGNIWAIAGSADIYKCPVGSTTFTAVGAGSKQWKSITTDPYGNIWAVVFLGDIYKCPAGSTVFTAVGAGSKYWSSVASDPTGNIWATVSSGGDIYKCPSGSTTFTAVGAGSASWDGVTSDLYGNIWVTAYNLGIYKCLSGSTIFISVNAGNKNFNGIISDKYGNIWAAEDGGDIYKCKAGSTVFTSVSAGNKSWYDLAADPSGNIWASVYNGDVYTAQKEILDAGTVLGVAPSTTGLDLLSSATPLVARTTLELGGASLLDVGTTSGTVCAGDDSRITDALARPPDGAILQISGDNTPDTPDATSGSGLYATPTIDESGNGNHLTNTACIPVYDSTLNRKVLAFNGTTSHIKTIAIQTMPDIVTIDWYGSVPLDASEIQILGAYGIGGDSERIHIVKETNSTNVRFYYAGVGIYVTVPLLLPHSTFTRLQFQFTWATGVLIVYRNGSLFGTYSTATGLIKPSGKYWAFGNQSTPISTQACGGYLSSANIYPRALDISEIRRLYRYGSPYPLYTLTDWRVAKKIETEATTATALSTLYTALSSMPLGKYGARGQVYTATTAMILSYIDVTSSGIILHYMAGATVGTLTITSGTTQTGTWSIQTGIV